MDVTNVWVANDEGTEIIRAREIACASLDYDGNVTVRLTSADGAAVTIAGHRTRHEKRRPVDFHRQLIRVIAELSDAAGAFLVRAAHDETRSSVGSRDIHHGYASGLYRQAFLTLGDTALAVRVVSDVIADGRAPASAR